MAWTSRSGTAFRVRVAFLLVVLVGVVVYALADIRRRSARRDWDHTLEVAFVVLRLGEVDAEATTLLAQRTSVLEERLRAELQRYRPGAPRPFAIRTVGPIAVDAPPPVLREEGIAALLGHTWRLRRYLADIDERAGVDASAFDARIYLAEPDRVPRYPQTFVEVMARNRPLSAAQEATPQSIDELAVGPMTAREIGWASVSFP